ncbi:MAG: S49 family peptidase, partial [Halobacteria archaeon]|nr:S49 family peptidase [Halobacteria archaeon]
ITYERLAAGDYKDAGTPLKEMSDDEREYLQGLVDGYYETFVERVTEERDLSEEEVRDTEAKVYLGKDAVETGLVDEIGTRDDVEEYISDEIGEEAEVREFKPSRGIKEQIRSGSAGVAYAFGEGIATVFGGSEGQEFEFRVKSDD